MLEEERPVPQLRRVTALPNESKIRPIIAERIAAWLASSFESNTTVVNDIPELGVVIGTTRGTERIENQDRLVAVRYSVTSSHSRGFILFALCDGMGGMKDGAVCAEMAIGNLIQSLVTSNEFSLDSRLHTAVKTANKAIFSRYHEQGGTTLSLLAKSAQGKLVALNVGDSRLYEFANSKQFHFRQISVDDTIAGEVERLRGVAFTTQNHADYLDRLAQYIGLGDGLAPRSYEASEFMTGSDFLLTSDGAHNIRNNLVGNIIRNASSASEIVRRLIQLSIWTGGLDNASIICVQNNVLRQLQPIKNPPYDLLEVWSPFGKFEIPFEATLEVFNGKNRGAEQNQPPSQSKNTLAVNEPATVKAKKRPRKKAQKIAASSKPDRSRKSKPQKELDIQVSINGDGTEDDHRDDS
ncbi:MAG: PP2C family serine/threonine-protein phosphatase [Thiohalomonadales bacterium]